MTKLAVTPKGQCVAILRVDGTEALVKYPNGRQGWMKLSELKEI